MRHIVFVSTEFDPVVPGGAGTVVAGLADSLRAGGDRVTVLLVVAEPTRGRHPWVTEILVGQAKIEEYGWPMAASRAAHEALADALEHDPADVVEFLDFDGLGFWSLSHRNGVLAEIPIGVRYHLPADHILDAIGVAPDGFRVVRVMEREALVSADFVISQTEAMRPEIAERYGIDGERIVVGPPPIAPVERVDYLPARSSRFCVIGRLSEQKGVHDLVTVLGPLLADRPDVTIEFIGSDGWSATHDRPMHELLIGIVPQDVRSQLVFTGPMPREDLPRHLSDARAVIVPSRLESFCLVAHEARNMGVPLIIRSQPVIEEHFSQGRGALLYDEPSDLEAVIFRVLADPAVLESVIVEPRSPDDVTGVYETLPDPRPRQAQAGLATAALYRLDAEANDRGRPSGRMSRLAGTLLRHLPDAAARVAVSVTPRAVKDRFRSVASWPEEQQRRAEEVRRSRIQDRIDAGAFPEIDDPEVSVIIPCYNQGHLVDSAVLSVFEQTHGSWEIVIVNDGSTDDATNRVLASIDTPRVRVISQENKGLPGARNTAIENSSGRFIVPLDADDELLPRYLDTMVEAFGSGTGIGFVHCWAELFGDVNWVWATRPYNPYTVLLSNSVLQTAMIRRVVAENVGGYDETLTTGNEDWDMWLRIQEAGWVNRQVRKPLYRYRKAGITMSVTNEADFEEGRRRMIQRHPNLYAAGAAASSKRVHYPLLSLVLEDDALPVIDVEDLQIVLSDRADDRLRETVSERNWGWVTGGSTRCESAIAATGKYVVFATRSTSFDGVEEAIESLEQDAMLAAAQCPSGTTVYRRWALIDRSSGFDGDLPADFATCQDPGWFVPSTMVVGGRTLDVVRQVPEEAGRLPDWLLP